MDSNLQMKRNFLTLYDYGSGGIWRYISARSADSIKSAYPKLEVFEQIPAWVDQLIRDKMINPGFVDIEDMDNPFLKALREDSKPGAPTK